MITESTYCANIPRFMGNIPSVVKAADARLPTKYGEFRIAGYRSLTSDEEFVAVYMGELRTDQAVAVRIHSQCLTGDVFHSAKCDCGEQLDLAMHTIANARRGVVVYQQQEGRGIGIINKIRAYALQDEGADTIEANVQLGLEIDARRYEQCVEILKDLGLSRVKAMTNNPDKIQAMRAGGLDIAERVAIELPPSKDTQKYLSVKRFQMGHLLNLVSQS